MLRENLRASTDTLTIRIPAKYVNHTLEVLVFPVEEIENLTNKNKSSGYNFSDLTGKIKWKGNAVSEQRKLRDEW